MHSRVFIALSVMFVMLVLSAPAAFAGGVTVNADNYEAIFSQIDSDAMDVIRSKKILVASRSYGLNMIDGLRALATQDSMYSLDINSAIINRHEDAHTDMPTDIFQQHNFNHYLVPLSNYVHPDIYDPSYATRVQDLDDYLNDAPYAFGSQVDIVMLEYHECHPDHYAYYDQKMAEWKAAFPNATFIYVTSGLALEQHSSDYNEDSWAFGQAVLDGHDGVDPIMDWRDLLSTDADGNRTYGHNMVPDFNINGDNLHPNSAYIEERLGKAFLATVYTTTHTPEPATLMLMAAGLPVLLRRRRKQG